MCVGDGTLSLQSCLHEVWCSQMNKMGPAAPREFLRLRRRIKRERPWLDDLPVLSQFATTNIASHCQLFWANIARNVNNQRTPVLCSQHVEVPFASFPAIYKFFVLFFASHSTCKFIKFCTVICFRSSELSFVYLSCQLWLLTWRDVNHELSCLLALSLSLSIEWDTHANSIWMQPSSWRIH